VKTVRDGSCVGDKHNCVGDVFTTAAARAGSSAGENLMLPSKLMGTATTTALARYSRCLEPTSFEVKEDVSTSIHFVPSSSLQQPVELLTCSLLQNLYF
jgi:hypothetical protein